MTQRRTKPAGAYDGREDDFQKAAIELVRTIAAPHGVKPEAVMHIPNGGLRNAIVGAKLKGMGTVKGYPDIMVFHPRQSIPNNSEETSTQPYCGIAQELKVWPNKPSPEQLLIHAILRNAGWLVHVCYGLEDVEKATNEYFWAR